MKNLCSLVPFPPDFGVPTDLVVDPKKEVLLLNNV